MIFNTPLPNDLLRNPPWPQTMITWPINDAFLSIIAASEEKLKDIGYYLKYGIEINLGLLSPSEAKAIQNGKGSPTLWAWRRSCNEQFSRDISEANLPTQFSITSSEVYSKLEEIAEQHKHRSTPESADWLSNWVLTQSFYQRSQGSLETKDNILAKKNFMVAALHLLPQHLGGLDGLVEQRFASEHYGYGWWDGKDILELRTLPTQGYESTIANYHQILWRLKTAVSEFGFVPIVANGMAQPHFSLWRIRDNKNIMAATDEEALSIRQEFADGMFQFFDELPVNNFSRVFDSTPVTSRPFVGSSRVSALRTCDGHWELRLNHISGVTHLARDIFFITSAACVSLEEQAPLNEEQRDMLDHVNWVFDTALGAPSSDRSVEKARRLAITADPPRVACPFVSCLEGGILGDKNEIIVPRSVFSWNHSMLSKAVGRHGVNLFSARIDGKNYNLETIIGWQELFKKIRITEDRTIDTSAIHPLLAKHFQGLTVAAINTDIHMPETKIGAGNKDREYADVVKAHFLAEGTLIRYADELLPHQQEIFDFVRKQCTTIDAEDAAPYLLTLYSRAVVNRTAKSATLSIAKAVECFLQDTMGESLARHLRYRGSLPVNWPSCFDEHYILRSILLNRENFLQVLPDVTQANPPSTSLFFKEFGNYLRDPAKLYGFENVADLFITMALTTALSIIVYVNSDENKNELLKGDQALADREGFHTSLTSTGKTVGASATRLVAAAQIGDNETRVILEQYSQQASTLTKRLADQLDAAKTKSASMSGLSLEFLSGVQIGMTDEVEQLLKDKTVVTDLRQKVVEGLHL